MEYTEQNSRIIDSWVDSGWEWGRPLTHEEFETARRGELPLLLTPMKPVPRRWIGDVKGKRILGLACGGGQQMPALTAMGAQCTVFDYSERQLDMERMVAEREGYEITVVKGDMTKPLPFEDESFDMIFHPVSNCYIKDVCHVWRECCRVLKRGGVLLAGLDNGISYAFDDAGQLKYRLPFDPLADEALMAECIENDWGIQFSHTVEEQIGGQIEAGLTIAGIYQDTDTEGPLSDHNVPAYYATRAVKGGK